MRCSVSAGDNATLCGGPFESDHTMDDCGVETAVIENDVTLLGGQFGENVRVLRVPDEDTTGGAIWCLDRLPNSHGEMFEPIGCVSRTCV